MYVVILPKNSRENLLISGEKAVYLIRFFYFFASWMKYQIYEDNYCYYVRKPAGYHSSFGEELSFLEIMMNEKDDKKIQEIITHWEKTFGKEEEFWLLNRLDTPTTGLLYFAKSNEIKKEYKKLQSHWEVQKFYIAEVWWDIWYYIKKEGSIINFDIAHHKFSSDRMVVLNTDLNLHKAKNPQSATTEILEREYSTKTKTSTLLIKITKGVRHQIRSHLSSIGYPIVGDSLYGKKKDIHKWKLELFSIGVKTTKSQFIP